MVDRFGINTLDSQNLQPDNSPDSANRKETFEGGQRETMLHSHDPESRNILLTPQQSTKSHATYNKNGKVLKDKADKLQSEAHLRVKVADRVKANQSYQTLFYGLKPNQERSSAIIHPLMFLLRRVVYALVIVFLVEAYLWGVFVVMFSCLCMLAFALTEFQWKDKIINF